MRIVVAGVPGSGKTTEAYKHREQGVILATDTLIEDWDWSTRSEIIAKWFDLPGSWAIEGCDTARALRKWMVMHPEGKPCDTVIWMPDALIARKKGAVGFGKGIVKVFTEILPELIRREVAIDVLSSSQTAEPKS